MGIPLLVRLHLNTETASCAEFAYLKTKNHVRWFGYLKRMLAFCRRHFPPFCMFIWFFYFYFHLKGRDKFAMSMPQAITWNNVDQDHLWRVMASLGHNESKACIDSDAVFLSYHWFWQIINKGTGSNYDKIKTENYNRKAYFRTVPFVQTSGTKHLRKWVIIGLEFGLLIIPYKNIDTSSITLLIFNWNAINIQNIKNPHLW